MLRSRTLTAVERETFRLRGVLKCILTDREAADFKLGISNQTQGQVGNTPKHHRSCHSLLVSSQSYWNNKWRRQNTNARELGRVCTASPPATRGTPRRDNGAAHSTPSTTGEGSIEVERQKLGNGGLREQRRESHGNRRSVKRGCCSCGGLCP